MTIIGGQMPVVAAQWIKIDFSLFLVPPEYPFVPVPKIHVRCLVCKRQFPVIDFTMKVGKRECPRCSARVPENMWQRIWYFMREGE